MNAMTNRYLFALATLATLIVILFSFYFEYIEHSIPCSLCLIERFLFIILFCFFFLGFLSNAKKILNISLLIMIFFISIIGLIFSGRHIWLQYFPVKIAEGCSADIKFLLTMFSLPEALMQILKTGADCAIKTKSFLFLQLSEWAFLGFLFFLLLTIYLLFRKIRYYNIT